MSIHNLAALAALNSVGMAVGPRRQESALCNDPYDYTPARIIFAQPRLLIGEPPKVLTKRQRRRLRGKAKS